MSYGTCDNCDRLGHRQRVRGNLCCELCRQAWIVGYVAACEDAMAGADLDVDPGASAFDVAVTEA